MMNKDHFTIKSHFLNILKINSILGILSGQLANLCNIPEFLLFPVFIKLYLKVFYMQSKLEWKYVLNLIKEA